MNHISDILQTSKKQICFFLLNLDYFLYMFMLCKFSKQIFVKFNFHFEINHYCQISNGCPGVQMQLVVLD